MTRILRRAAAVTTMCLVAASGAAGQSRPDADVSVRETSKGVYQVEARFEVAEPAAAVWAVLTDYANIPRFVKDVRVSIVRERSEGHARVEQEAVSSFMMFSRRVHLLLAIAEDGDVLSFRDECGRSFTQYTGSWRAYKRGAARVMLQKREEALADLRAAQAPGAAGWVRGRAHVEVAKIALQQRDRPAAQREAAEAVRICTQANDPICVAEAKKIR